MGDKEVKKKKKVGEIPKRPPEHVFNRFKVFRYIASHLAKRKMCEQSLPFYKLAEDFARGRQQECLLATERAKVYCLLGDLSKARKDVDRALTICPDNLNTHLVNAGLLFAEDEIENSLIVSHMGLRKRNLFARPVRADSGVIENTVGINAGPMMTMKKLGPTIVTMKKKDIGTYISPPPLSPLDMRKRESAYELKLKCYTEKCLGPLAIEKAFLQDLLKNKTIFTGTHSERLKDIITDCISLLDRKQESLWQRFPLYTQEYLTPRLSEKLKTEMKRHMYNRVAVLNNEGIRQLLSITEFINNNEWVAAYRKCMNMWRFLSSKPYSLLPNKRIMSESLYEIMGSLYLSSKTLMASWSDKLNDERIYYMFGIFKPYTIRMEMYKDSFHADVLNPKVFITEMLEHFNNSNDSLEQAVIAHELACAYSMIKSKEKTRQFARHCVFESKRAPHLIWYLNGLFILSRAELQQANIREARITLTAARDLTKIFGFTDAYNFLVRALALLSKETEESLRGGASIAMREKKLLDLMATPQLRFACSKQLAYTNSLPVNLRMSVLPGVKPRKESKKPIQKQDSENQALNVKLREEDIQKMIRKRFTLTAPGITPQMVSSEDVAHLLLK